MGQARLESRVAGDVPASGQGLAEDDVVDRLGWQSAAPGGLADDDGGELEGVGVPQTPPAGGSDGGAARREKNGINHEIQHTQIRD
jgi:hypothetical protein